MQCSGGSNADLKDRHLRPAPPLRGTDFYTPPALFEHPGTERIGPEVSLDNDVGDTVVGKLADPGRQKFVKRLFSNAQRRIGPDYPDLPSL